MGRKYFIVADVHGFWEPLQNALRENGFDEKNPDHWFVSCGDLFDRGADAVKILEWVNQLERKILIMGNHDLFLDNAIANGSVNSADIHNGTWSTICQLAGADANLEPKPELVYAMCTMAKTAALDTYFENLAPYAQLGRYILVHGWLPCEVGTDKIREDWGNASFRDWCYASMARSPAKWKDYWEHPLTNEDGEPYVVVCGHWHASEAHVMDNDGVMTECFPEDPNAWQIFDNHNMIALDLCTVLSGKVGCIVLEEGE